MRNEEDIMARLTVHMPSLVRGGERRGEKTKQTGTEKFPGGQNGPDAVRGVRAFVVNKCLDLT